MKKVLALVLIGLFLVSTSALADTRRDLIDVVVNTIGGEGKSESIQSCTYDEETDAIYLVGTIGVAYDSLMAAKGNDPQGYKDTIAEGLFAAIASIPGALLETAKVEGVTCITTILTSDDVPVYLSVNGADVSWMLRHERLNKLADSREGE